MKKWLWGIYLASFTLGCVGGNPKDPATATDPEPLYQQVQSGLPTG